MGTWTAWRRTLSLAIGAVSLVAGSLALGIDGDVVVWNDDVPLQPELAVGGFGSGKLSFDDPLDVATVGDDRVYILDADNNRVQVLDGDGRFESEWRLGHPGGDAVDDPVAMAASPADGSVHILDGETGQVHRYTAEGKHLLSFGRFGLGKGQHQGAVDLAVDRQGNVYVLDRKRRKVLKWRPDGTFLREWGLEGTRRDEFQDPVSVCYSDELLGFVVVLDPRKAALLRFDRDGRFDRAIDLSALASRTGEGFLRIEADGDGDLFLLEGQRGKLIRLGRRMSSVFQLGEAGARSEKLGGMAVDEDGRIYVTDRGRDKVMRFTMDLD